MTSRLYACLAASAFFAGSGSVAHAQNTFVTRSLSAELPVETDTINGVTVSQFFLGAGDILDPSDGFLVSVSNFGLGTSWSGSLNAGFANESDQTLTLHRGSGVSVRVLAADGTVLAGNSLGSTPAQSTVEIAPGSTYYDSYVFGGGSAGGSLSPGLVGYFNQPVSTPFLVRTGGVNVTLPDGLAVTSTSGLLTGTATLSGTLRYFNDFIWDRAGGGDLSDNASWRVGTASPSGAGTHVAFGRAATADSEVRLTSSLVLGKLYFDNPDHAYTITHANPGQSLTLSASTAANRGVEVRSGSHAIRVPLVVSQGSNTGLLGPSGVGIYLLPGTRLGVGGGITGSGVVLKGGEGTLEFDTTPSTTAMHVADGLVRFRGVGHGGTIYANVSESTPGLESLAVVEFALERSVAWTAPYQRSSLGLLGTATGGALRVVSDSGRAHTLTLSPTTASTYQDGTDLLSGHVSVGHDSALGTGALRVNPSAADQAALSASGGARTLGNAIQILAHDLTLLGSGQLRLNGAISGPGALVKLGAGHAILAGANTFAGGLDIREGSVEALSNSAFGSDSVTVRETGALRVASGVTIANRIDLFAGATLQLAGVANNVALQGGVIGGTGRVDGVVGGTGTISPGNSEGILTISSIDPSAGLSFDFRFTAGSPDFAQPAASLNDVLFLTDAAAPFAAPLDASNTVRIYLAESFAFGGSAHGGFFTELPDTAALLAAISNASFEFYLEDIGGAFTFEGRNHHLLDASRITLGADLFAAPGGDVAALRVTVAPIPEPASAAVLGGMAAAFFALGRRRRARTHRRGRG